MKNFLVIALASFISLSAFATSPYEELEGLYKKGVDAKLSDFPTYEDIAAQKRKPLQGITSYVTPTTARNQVAGGIVGALFNVKFQDTPEIKDVPAAGPVFPEVPGTPPTFSMKQVLVSGVDLADLKKGSDTIAEEIKALGITSYSFGEDHGQVVAKFKTRGKTDDLVYRINNGLIIAKRSSVSDDLPNIGNAPAQDPPIYTYYWTN